MYPSDLKEKNVFDIKTRGLVIPSLSGRRSWLKYGNLQGYGYPLDLGAGSV